jgi:fluoroquinolone transport system permease protein
MIQITLFKNDIKQILRDPVMTLLLVAPLLLIIVFKILEVFLIPFLVQKTGFDVMPYASYVFSFILLMNSGMLGIVTGFMMLDERDGNIAQLLEITPLGRSGYLVNRLSFASLLSIVYCLVSFAVFSLVASTLLFCNASLPFIGHLHCHNRITHLLRGR